MRNEVYRSFDGSLSAEVQRGYIIFDCGDYWEIVDESIWGDEPRRTTRISKKYSFDFTDLERIGELEIGVDNGNVEGQSFYNGKWYPTELINKIQKKYRCRERLEDWRKYVR